MPVDDAAAAKPQCLSAIITLVVTECITWQAFLEKFNELKDIVFENTIVRSCQEEAASFTRKSDAYHVAEMFVRQDILKSQSMSGSHKETGDKGKGRA